MQPVGPGVGSNNAQVILDTRKAPIDLGGNDAQTVRDAYKPGGGALIESAAAGGKLVLAVGS